MNKLQFRTVEVALVAAPSFAQQTATKYDLVGAWKVVTLKATSAGKVSYPHGDRVSRYVGVIHRFEKAASRPGPDRCSSHCNDELFWLVALMVAVQDLPKYKRTSGDFGPVDVVKYAEV